LTCSVIIANNRGEDAAGFMAATIASTSIIVVTDYRGVGTTGVGITRFCGTIIVITAVNFNWLATNIVNTGSCVTFIACAIDRSVIASSGVITEIFSTWVIIIATNRSVVASRIGIA